MGVASLPDGTRTAIILGLLRGLALVKPNEIQRGVLKIDGAVCMVMAIATTQEAPPSQAGMFTL